MAIIDNYEASLLLEGQTYKFSKTMPHIPHSYTLKETWHRPEQFEDVVQYIRDAGVQEKWGRYNHHYLYLNGFKYWTMGAPVGETILINRAMPPDEHPYDNIAPNYDGVFGNKKYQTENKELFKLLDIKGYVLDVGCGTGLAVEWAKINPEWYWGIDPSEGMLQKFMWKHPQYATRIRKCPFEQFYMTGFDTILALFGTASYMENTQRVRQLLNAGGKAYLMHLKEDYMPITYEKTGVIGGDRVASVNKENKIIDFNNYWLEIIEQ